MIPKYTPFERQTMSFIVLNEKQNDDGAVGDPCRSDRLVARLVEETGLTEDEVWRRIQFLAVGGTV